MLFNTRRIPSRLFTHSSARCAALLIGLLGLLSAMPVAAQDIEWIAGPEQVKLGKNLATLDLPAGFMFANAKDTKQLLAAMGNRPSGDEIGLVAPSDEEANWFVIFEYEAVGFVKDDDKDEIDADGLFKTIYDATEAGNEWRRENGFGELHVSRWEIEPHYDEASHHLKWALLADAGEDGNSINFNERLLGRGGVVSVTLVTDSATFSSDRQGMTAVLDGFSFNEGNRYADFKSGDKIAQFGLAALIVGGAGAAAVKLGLFAVLAKFLAKAWKLVAVGAVALFAAIRRMLGIGRKEEQEWKNEA